MVLALSLKTEGLINRGLNQYEAGEPFSYGE